MYFVIVKEISSEKIVDKAELSVNNNIGGELAHLAWLTKRQFENRYPPDQYYVSYEEANNWDELQLKLQNESKTIIGTSDQSQSSETFTMIGSRSYLFLVNIGAMIAGTIILFFLLIIRLIYNPFLFILGIFILFIYMYIDYKRWMKKGIQMVSIDKDGLTVYRGQELIQTRVDKKQITGINVFKKLNRRIVNILLGGYADSSFPGITLFSGPRIRITDDAFREAEFGIFIEKLRELKPELRI
ncbi:MAG: hypothetical protein WC879_08995 [Melioribacteraceae bacterium]